MHVHAAQGVVQGEQRPGAPGEGPYLLGRPARQGLHEPGPAIAVTGQSGLGDQVVGRSLPVVPVQDFPPGQSGVERLRPVDDGGADERDDGRAPAAPVGVARPEPHLGDLAEPAVAPCVQLGQIGHQPLRELGARVHPARQQVPDVAQQHRVSGPQRPLRRGITQQTDVVGVPLPRRVPAQPPLGPGHVELERHGAPHDPREVLAGPHPGQQVGEGRQPRPRGALRDPGAEFAPAAADQGGDRAHERHLVVAGEIRIRLRRRVRLAQAARRSTARTHSGVGVGQSCRHCGPRRPRKPS